MIKIQENETDSTLMYNWNVLSDENQGTILSSPNWQK